MHLVFRILDSDVHRLKEAESSTLHLIREYGLDGEVFQVAEMLEHGRLSVAEALPALEINGVIVSRKVVLTEGVLREIMEKLHDHDTRVKCK
jgi:hypothetical protein